MDNRVKTVNRGQRGWLVPQDRMGSQAMQGPLVPRDQQGFLVYLVCRANLAIQALVGPSACQGVSGSLGQQACPVHRVRQEPLGNRESVETEASLGTLGAQGRQGSLVSRDLLGKMDPLETLVPRVKQDPWVSRVRMDWLASLVLKGPKVSRDLKGQPVQQEPVDLQD